MINLTIDKDKAKASLLYIVANIPNIDKHKLYKIQYFAEQEHLVKYGRPITGDAFIKMEYGPVPSYIKDKVEHVKDDDGSVDTNGIFIIANEYPDMDELSESDIECLDGSIDKHKNKSFSQLTKDSHKTAWENATDAGKLDIIDIAKEANADEGIIDYILKSYEDNRPIY